MLINNSVVLYENLNFNNVAHRINMAKVGRYSIAPGPAPYHIVCHMPGKTGQPSFGRLFQYCKFQANDAIANKSFFQVISFFF